MKADLRIVRRAEVAACTSCLAPAISEGELRRIDSAMSNVAPARSCRAIWPCDKAASSEKCVSSIRSRATRRIASCIDTRSGKANEIGRCAGLRRSTGNVMRALIPSTPQSPLNSPVRSGPKWRVKGAVPAAAPPVESSDPSAVTTSNDSTESAEMP